MKFVENIKQAWKWISMQMMVLALALQTAWELAPSDLKSMMDPTLVYGITVVILVMGVIGRLVKQTPNDAQ